ncbi:MAG: hypothetical protein LQ349_004890 [Xanthoria aureola]|nr:MAG: hypothetical protein LQ349_004890 [Xanthoria aureola]
MIPAEAINKGQSSPSESSGGSDRANPDGASHCAATITASDTHLRPASLQATDAGFPRLQELIQSLPLELFDQIRETVYELAFCPGFAFPHRQNSQGTYEWNGTVYNTILPQLLRISKDVRESYQTKIFSENIFVVGPGQTDRTLRFLGLGERRHPLPIRRAHASFSYRDLGEDWAEQLPIGVAPPSEEDSANPPYLKRKIRRAAFNGKPEQSYCAAQARLIGLWIAKYGRLSQLPLEELTLDFTECYGGCNEWLGSYVAKMVRVGSPPARSSLRVIAPDDGERLYIHDILSKPSR